MVILNVTLFNCSDILTTSKGNNLLYEMKINCIKLKCFFFSLIEMLKK